MLRLFTVTKAICAREGTLRANEVTYAGQAAAMQCCSARIKCSCVAIVVTRRAGGTRLVVSRLPLNCIHGVLIHVSQLQCARVTNVALICSRHAKRKRGSAACVACGRCISPVGVHGPWRVHLNSCARLASCTVTLISLSVVAGITRRSGQSTGLPEFTDAVSSSPGCGSCALLLLNMWGIDRASQQVHRL